MIKNVQKLKKKNHYTKLRPKCLIILELLQYRHQASLLFLVFFVYQTLFADSKPKNSKSNPKKKKISDTKESIKKEPKKGLFNRKSKTVEENLTFQKKGLFGRKKEVIKEEIKPKKKGWFKQVKVSKLFFDIFYT